MKEIIAKFIENKKYFKRLLGLTALIIIGIVLLLNVECGVSKKDGFYFKFTPAADIKVDVEKKL